MSEVPNSSNPLAGPPPPVSPDHARPIRWVEVPVPIPNVQVAPISTAFDILWKTTITVLVALILINPSCLRRPWPIPPGPGPTPGPTLSLATAFAADTDPDKITSARSLASVYRNQAPAAADRVDITTIGDLDRTVRDASVQAIGALTLANTRTAIGTYLHSRIPTKRETPLTAALRTQIKAEFTKVALALEALH